MSQRIATLTAATLAVVGALAARAPAQTLGIGDPAPPLQVKMVKGDSLPTTLLGKTFVVEFWATWCGPCKKSIPHVSELQKKYPGVTIVGVSIWENDPTAVAPFVEQMGDRMAYAVAMDVVPEGKDGGAGAMAQSWMQAAGERGIPSAFIVNAQGKIAWIGYPMEMDAPLEQIVAGKWDIEAAARERKEAFEREAKLEAINERIKSALRAKDYKTAIAAIDEAIAMDAGVEKRFAQARFRALYDSQSYEQAFLYGRKLVEVIYKDDAMALNQFAWFFVDPAAKLEQRDLELALAAAVRATELLPEDPAILDTLAAVHFEKGDLVRAIEVQAKAAELSAGTSYEKELKERLEQYKKAAQGQKN